MELPEYSDKTKETFSDKNIDELKVRKKEEEKNRKKKKKKKK